jgi:hypothetical protein
VCISIKEWRRREEKGREKGGDGRRRRGEERRGGGEVKMIPSCLLSHFSLPPLPPHSYLLSLYPNYILETFKMSSLYCILACCFSPRASLFMQKF